MPVDKQVQLRYEVLNKCFRDLYREYTIDDLVDACNKAMLKAFDMEDGVSKRTVQNDIANLQMPPYNIRLDENLKNGRKRIYRYYDTNFTLPQFRMNDSDRNKIQAAVNVLENYAGEPLLDWARTLFGDLLQAILNKKVLKLTYAPFGKDAYEARVYPYHLKQFNDRWYLIAQAVGYDTLGHYALDRIERFEEIGMPYVESEVDFSEYFDDVIGVTVPERFEPVDVILRVSNNRFNYIKTKPLHLSQRVIGEDRNHTRISINVKINKELIALILSFGADIEVLAPASLRAEIAKKIRAMNDNYPNYAENLHS